MKSAIKLASSGFKTHRSEMQSCSCPVTLLCKIHLEQENKKDSFSALVPDQNL